MLIVLVTPFSWRMCRSSGLTVVKARALTTVIKIDYFRLSKPALLLIAKELPVIILFTDTPTIVNRKIG